jgi:hypothetical protein
MSKYLELIERARLVTSPESCTTTGDVEYPGTALEIADQDGNDLFHIVIDSKGRRQVLFFALKENYRLPLDLLEQIIARAKDSVADERNEP